MLKRLLIFTSLFLVGGMLCAVGATSLHLWMVHAWSGLRQLAPQNSFKILASQEAARLIFLGLLTITLMLVVLLYLKQKSTAHFSSPTRRIAGAIETPITAGQRQHGSAQWLDRRRFSEVFANYTLTGREGQSPPASGGVVLGRELRGLRKQHEKLFYVDEDTHCLCIGATRSGKSRSVVLQSIGLLGLAGESMVISDPKQELFHYTAPYLESLGYEIVTLDFRSPRKSARYNFLQPVIDAVHDGDTPRAVDAAWDITTALVGEPRGEKIWTYGEASIIASAILAVVIENADHPEYQNMTNVYAFISEMCRGDGKELPLAAYMRSLPDLHPAKALLGIAEVAPARTRGSFFTSALTTLRLFTNPLIYEMTSATDFEPCETSSHKRALFILLPDEKLTYYPLASLFIAQHYQTLVEAADARGGRLKVRTNFLMDELANFTAIPEFTTKLTVGGGRGIRFDLFVQSLAQLDEKYGRENAKTLKSNCQVWIYLQADDIETLEEISKRLGNYTVSTVSQSQSYNSANAAGSSSSSANLTGRALLTPDEVRLIGRPHSLVMSRSYPALMEAPDIGQYRFNALFGMGDREHNRELRERREALRPLRLGPIEIRLWGIWKDYQGPSSAPQPARAGASVIPRSATRASLFQRMEDDP